MNELNKEKISKQLSIFIVSIWLIAAVILIIALVLELNGDSKLNNITYLFYSVSSSLIASIIVVHASAKMTGDPVHFYAKKTEEFLSNLSSVTESSVKTGLICIYNSRSIGQDIYFKLLEKEWEVLEIMGIKVEFLGRDARFENTIKNACQRNAIIRILLVDVSDSKRLSEREIYESQPGFSKKAIVAINSYKQVIKKFTKVGAEFSKPEIRYHNEYLPISMVRIDDDILFYFRLRNQHGSGCPLFHFKKTINEDPFYIYTNEFNILWEKYKLRK